LVVLIILGEEYKLLKHKSTEHVLLYVVFSGVKERVQCRWLSKGLDKGGCPVHLRKRRCTYITEMFGDKNVDKTLCKMWLNIVT
jgi:hypothetical protein